MTEEKSAFEKMREVFSAEKYEKWLGLCDLTKADYVGIDLGGNAPIKVKDILDNFGKNKSND